MLAAAQDHARSLTPQDLEVVVVVVVVVVRSSSGGGSGSQRYVPDCRKPTNVLMFSKPTNVLSR